MFSYISDMPRDEAIAEINRIKLAIHEVSPFKNEPIDCVIWVKSSDVRANDYNPNSVAPPEMALLEISITNDGYTQPIVAWPTASDYEVVDGFHRTRIGKESKIVSDRVGGYLPIVSIKESQTGKGYRIASTIRHNRASEVTKPIFLMKLHMFLRRRIGRRHTAGWQRYC